MLYVCAMRECLTHACGQLTQLKSNLSGNLQFNLEIQQMKQGVTALLRCGFAQLLHHSTLAPAAQTVAAAKCTCNQTLTLLTLASATTRRT